MINQLMAEAIALARAQYGERTYSYERIGHTRRPALRRRKAQWFTTITPRPAITRQEYDENVTQGKADELAQFRGKLNRSHYCTYRRKQETDGWQDALIAIIEATPPTEDDAE